MRFLLDENLSFRVCAYLNAVEHDAVHVKDVGLAGADDSLVLSYACEHERVLVSCDHDFVHMLFASGDQAPSILLTREVETLSSAELGDLIVAALSPDLEDFLTKGAIATLTQKRVRVRPLPLRQ